MKRKLPKDLKRVHRPKKKVIFDPDFDRCWIEWRMVHGLMEISFYSPNWIAPLAILWGISIGKGNTNSPGFEVAHVTVVEWARRLGICRRLHEWIFDAWKGPDTVKAIRTADGSIHGGSHALTGLGYKHNAETDVWFLTRAALAETKKK